MHTVFLSWITLANLSPDKGGRTPPDYRRLVNELLGWNLVVNAAVVKLEKVPPRAMPWMGL